MYIDSDRHCYNSYNIHWKQIHETGQLGQYDVITVRRKHAFFVFF